MTPINFFRNIRLRKRSQAEIIGITIVMVLIMLGIVFVIKFVIMPENPNIKQIYDEAQVGANFIDAMLSTKTSCHSQSMIDLIDDCFDNFNNPSFQKICPQDIAPDVIICDDPSGCHSCEYLNRTLEYMLNNSLIAIEKNFDLFICEWDDINGACDQDLIVSYFNYKSCLEANVEYNAKQTPIPGSGYRVVQIYIC